VVVIGGMCDGRADDVPETRVRLRLFQLASFPTQRLWWTENVSVACRMGLFGLSCSVSCARYQPSVLHQPGRKQRRCCLFRSPIFEGGQPGFEKPRVARVTKQVFTAVLALFPWFPCSLCFPVYLCFLLIFYCTLWTL
jgi:hypothetical protein